MNSTFATDKSTSKGFNKICYDRRTGTCNIASTHEDSIYACMDRCAAYAYTDKRGQEECISIVYDNSLQEGYENCDLLAGFGSSSGDVNSAFAQLTLEQLLADLLSLDRCRRRAVMRGLRGRLLGRLLVLSWGFWSSGLGGEEKESHRNIEPGRNAAERDEWVTDQRFHGVGEERFGWSCRGRGSTGQV
ncbi:uncharacterized protein BDV17DRAFT_285908 [Aspergillus undulatus]|uniref:uncharacterized protein n=1 Tax=Aspergillus undulatus TaxID=1810928 RepID=UPI003CCE33DE